MPLAKYITEFQALDRKAQATAVIRGEYSKDQLTKLYKYATSATVRDTIDDMINHGELDLPAVIPAKSATVALLDPIAAQINDEYTHFEDLEKQATMSMLKIGLLMEHAKEQLPHGQFKKWAEANLTVKYRHAHNFRKLAQVFIAAQHVDQGEMLALVDPANSKAELGDKLRQMAFDFLGDKTQAELFAEYGIQVREKAAPKELPKPAPKSLPEGETAEHMVAHATWSAIGAEISEYGLNQQSWAHLTDDERWNIYQLVHELDQQLKATFKKGGK